MMYRVYGIKNCDTVKKALRWLDENKVEYEFVDFKKNKPTRDLILRWKESFLDWPVNRRGRTFKLISDEFDKSSDDKKISLIQEKTSSIKRPILEKSGKSPQYVFGFNPEEYKGLV